jgi:hypothetical protein
MRAFLPVVGLGILLCGCTQTEFASNSEPSVQRYVDDVLKTCADYRAAGKLTKVSKTITFADPATEVSGTVCKWGVGDNAPMRGGAAAARYEQLQSVNLDSAWLVCGMNIDFPDQLFQYDDHFFLTLNDNVVATSTSALLEHFPRQTLSIAGQSTEVYRYGWEFIRDKSHGISNSIAQDYCVGMGALSNCSWPLTEQTGSITMDMHPNLVVALANNYFESNKRFDLEFITTGDDNPSSDCQHKPITFTVDVEYIKGVATP